jgi:integrase
VAKFDLWDGLNIYRSRGKWYVYHRATGDALLRGFVGDRADLKRKLKSPEFIAAYNRPRLRARPAKTLPIETLGGFVHWFTNGDIDRTPEQLKADDRFGENPDGYPKWRTKLAAATRKDYLEAFDWLRDEFDIALADITQPDLYELRDKCANKKWPRFADQMIAALSSMFRQAKKRGKMTINPCLGMEKAHEADPNANREWYPEEWKVAFERAPMEIKIPMMLARYAGLRGQTIVAVLWKQYRDHDLTGKCFRFVARKTKKSNAEAFVPAMPELQEFLAGLKRGSTLIALRDDGTPWESEVDMQTRVSHWLRDQERAGLIGAGTTLHGLRVTYAAWLSRHGASDKEVAAGLGDKSTRMGAHYTRHVENEANVVRAFKRVKDAT